MKQPTSYVIHPLFIILALVLAAMTALFLGFTVAYVYSRVQNGLPPVQIPFLFYINTIFLLSTSFLFIKTKESYKEDNTALYKKLLWLILGLTLFFLCSQVIAWRQMMYMNIDINSTTLGSYLYVISGIHFLHVLFGVPFLVFFLIDARRRLVEPTSVLLYLSDQDKMRKLRALTIYWHYLDALWIFFVLFFLINRLI